MYEVGLRPTAGNDCLLNTGALPISCRSCCHLIDRGTIGSKVLPTCSASAVLRYIEVDVNLYFFLLVSFHQQNNDLLGDTQNQDREMCTDLDHQRIFSGFVLSLYIDRNFLDSICTFCTIFYQCYTAIYFDNYVTKFVFWKEVKCSMSTLCALRLVFGLYLQSFGKCVNDQYSMAIGQWNKKVFFIQYLDVIITLRLHYLYSNVLGLLSHLSIH